MRDPSQDLSNLQLAMPCSVSLFFPLFPLSPPFSSSGLGLDPAAPDQKLGHIHIKNLPNEYTLQSSVFRAPRRQKPLSVVFWLLAEAKSRG